jgi:hypothetical protein
VAAPHQCKETRAKISLQNYLDRVPAPSQPDLPGFDASQDVVLGAGELRGLAHPLRLRLRSELIEHGAATASQLAARIGESSGATSYHLRQLARFGFVADEPGRGSGRERYWRAVHRSTWFDKSALSPPDRAVGAEYLRAVGRLYADRVVRSADSFETTIDDLGQEWTEAWQMSDWLLDLDAEEAAELGRRFHELCAPFHHRSDAPDAGKCRVVVQFQILPVPDTGP